MLYNLLSSSASPSSSTTSCGLTAIAADFLAVQG